MTMGCCDNYEEQLAGERDLRRELVAALVRIQDWLLETEAVPPRKEQYLNAHFVRANNLVIAVLAKARAIEEMKW